MSEGVRGRGIAGIAGTSWYRLWVVVYLFRLLRANNEERMTMESDEFQRSWTHTSINLFQKLARSLKQVDKS